MNPFQDTPTIQNIDIPDILGQFEVERTDGSYYTFIDMDNNREIDKIAREVYEGDELILADNSLYRVVEINEDTVLCEYLGQEEVTLTRPVLGPVMAQNNKGTVGIYMTHTAESFVPTSGTESKPGDGDIINVGRVIANTLEEKGVNVSFSDNVHDPHDANAYQRSRRTIAQLLKKRPVALIDVHRDGVPDPNFYATEIDGDEAVQIRLVVGRQNQNMQANMDFAKQMKAYYDEVQPGLIKGIFKAKGNYNQDLGPRTILIEVGTHTNSAEQAKKSAAVFASHLPGFLGLGTEGGAKGAEAPADKTSKGTISSIIWLLVIFFIGGLAFLFISTGSIEGSVNKLRNFGKEFTSYLGPLRRKNKK
jgi:stage II sporulation protein P